MRYDVERERERERERVGGGTIGSDSAESLNKDRATLVCGREVLRQ